MMKKTLLACGLAASLAAPALAQGVPEPLRGAWFAGDCADPQAMLVMTGRAAVRVESEAPARLVRFRDTREAGGWTLGTGTGAEAPRLLFRGVAEGLETAEPDPKTRDDRLPGDARASVWRRCPAPPALLAGLHGEGVAALAAIEHVEAACAAGTPAACADAIVRQGDVSGDALLSAAELARLTRGIAWVVAAQEGATQDVLLGATAAGTLAGVLTARLLIESMDYDGDGKLSARELALDATGFARATGTAEGAPLRTDGLAEGAGMLRGLIDGLMNR
ncbi:hypothetical protein [Falsiroseomonas sp. CW058]|uniref:hypothetical protein n=1 Tax=Falsiroseomonas sp. CW058 TaxID=3388664 RepID=UPI003D3148C5